MENQNNNLAKGEQMEEYLRNYFLGLGYYVVRGIKFKYQGLDVTDVDLWVYSSSALTRLRTNVDIKNKKTPQALERIFWAKGVKEILGFDRCIVATTEKRESVREFGLLHNVTILDGNLLSQLKTSKQTVDRISEEDFLELLSEEKSKKIGTDWKIIYEIAKSRLIDELDFSGCNATLNDIKHFAEQVIVNTVKREIACRTLYLLISYFLISLDFLTRDLSFLDQQTRSMKLSDGFKFGNLGKSGLEKTMEMAIKISGSSNHSIDKIKSMIENLPTDILTDYFANLDNLKKLFRLGKEFEASAFSRTFQSPNHSSFDMQSLILLFLDFLGIERKKFLGHFQKKEDK
jgi:hypothetical protein